MKTKKTGIILIVTGVLMVIFTGVRLLKIEEIINVGNSGITSTRSDAFFWSPLFGICMILAGIGFCLISLAKRSFN
jgi:hypothetical protein